MCVAGEMRALYCGPHKLEGMVNVDQERRTCNRSERPHMPWISQAVAMAHSAACVTSAVECPMEHPHTPGIHKPQPWRILQLV